MALLVLRKSNELILTFTIFPIYFKFICAAGIIGNHNLTEVGAGEETFSGIAARILNL